VTWAERWAKGKESHARFLTARARTRIFMVGAIFAVVGGSGLYSDTKHQIHGRSATATLIQARVPGCLR